MVPMKRQRTFITEEFLAGVRSSSPLATPAKRLAQRPKDDLQPLAKLTITLPTTSA